MENNAKMSQKDFFLNLGVIVSLYVGVISWLALLFQLIDRALPDALDYAYGGDFYSSGMRAAISTLIIVFPLFIWLSRLLRRSFMETPAKKDLGIRKWLVHITLFLAGIAIVVDLIVLINAFLQGELTGRFVLKVLAVLVVAVIVFGFYLSDLKKRAWVNEKWPSIIVSLMILATLVWGFVSVGSPFNQRLVRFDERKVQDLSDIQWRIINYWQQKGELPEELSDLEDSISGYRAPVDPQTGEAYEYRLGDTDSFELCANFNLSSVGGSKNSLAPIRVGDNWDHEAGEQCFGRTIDHELYPVRDSAMLK